MAAHLEGKSMADTPSSKITQIEKAAETGDAKAANAVLNTIANSKDQSVYMNLLKNKMANSPVCLPDCKFLDTDKDGTTDVIKTPKITIEKITTSGGEQKIQATSTESPGFLRSVTDSVTGAVGKLVESILPSAPSPEARRQVLDAAVGNGVGRAHVVTPFQKREAEATSIK